MPSSERRKKAIEARTAPKESPFSRIAQPVPTFAMSKPATAGPIIWAAVKEVEFKGDGVWKVAVTDHLGHEGLPNRSIKRRGRARQESEHVDVPEPNGPFYRENSEQPRKQAHRCLSKHQQPALIQPVRSWRSARRRSTNGS
jgi:hypothetical protein